MPMRNLLSYATLSLVATSAIGGQIDAETSEARTPWTSLAANDAAEDFHFVIVSDRTGGERPGVFESALPKVNLLEPAFVVSVGDLIEGYTDDQAQIDAEWDEFEGFVDQLTVPFFYVAGNHDMDNAVMAETWRARFGPSYYHFVYKDVLFLVLNSELFGMVSKPDTPVPGPWTQAEQLAFVERTLERFPDPRWTIVVVHQPLWDYASGPRGDWPEIERMLGSRDYTVFAGHFHRYVKLVRNDRRYITLSTTGGGSSLRGTQYGEFDHVAWVTMTASGPRIANLLLDGIHGEDVVTRTRRDAIRTLSGAVRSLPVIGDGDTFEDGTVAFEIVNRGPMDLQASYAVAPGHDLVYAGRPRMLTVAPGARERVELRVASGAPVAYTAIAPGRVIWSLSTGEDPVTVKTVAGLLPVGTPAIPRGDAPTLDGVLDDWDELPFRADAQGDVASPATAATDVSFAFALREAGGDLYLAASVVDDSVVASDVLGPRVQDALVINVDSRPEPQRSANVPLYPATRDGHVARMARAHLTVVAARPEPPDDYLRASQADVRWRARRTERGYSVEAKIPGSFLDAQADGRWDVLRIAVTAVDWDEGEITNEIPWDARGSSGAALHWQPDRFGDAPVAGSGTFVRGPSP
ncbi:MAG: metallophosphoesterase [Gammaproteobacteria bacterium]|nr:metallophosphoesterase [Gammaproteobacteria bacterium]